MKILFIGNEEDYARATNRSASDAERSLFFAPSLQGFHPSELIQNFFVLIIPVSLLSMQKLLFPDEIWPLPVLASGPDCNMDEALALDCADYLCEPWSSVELEARARKCARVTFANGSIYIEGTCLKGPMGTHSLTAKDLLALRFFHANLSRSIPRQALNCILSLQQETRALDMRISRLRTLFKNLGATGQEYIQRGSNGSYSIL